MRFGWVLLDVGETLLGPRVSFGTVYARILGAHGLPSDPSLYDRALRATWEEVTAALPPGTDRYGAHPRGEEGYWLGVVARALEHAGLGGDAVAERVLEPLRNAFAEPEAWTVYPDVEPALSRLRRAGVRLGVVSNWDSRLPVLLHRLGLRERFDTLAVSALEGVEKPDPRLFRVALERLGADRARTLHVGDVPALDAAGARAAGIHAALVDRRGGLGPAAFPDLSAVVEWALR
jgi:putative hydrolase of the HAD superfamily